MAHEPASRGRCRSTRGFWIRGFWVRRVWVTRLFALAACALACGCNPETGPPVSGPPPVKLDVEDPAQRAAYLLGLAAYRDLRVLRLSDAEFELALLAMRDLRAERAQIALDEITQSEVMALQMERLSARMDENEAFVASAAKQPGAEKLPSGAIFFEQKAGSGESPTLSDSVRVSFRGTYADGEEFDSTGDNPEIYPLEQVITCWQEALAKMKVGGQAKVVCPPQTYTGMELAGDMRIGETLQFDIELIMFRPTQKGDTTAPAAAPPGEAPKASGEE